MKHVYPFLRGSLLRGLVEPRDMSLPFSERRAFLMFTDLLAINATLLFSLWQRPEYQHAFPDIIFRRFYWWVFLSLVWLLVAYAVDAYDLRVSSRFSSSFVAVAKAVVITCVVYILVPFLSPTLPSARRYLFILPLMMLSLAMVGRGFYIVALTQPLFRHRVLIVGAGWAGRTIAEVLAGWGDGTYQVVGFVDDNPSKRQVTLQVPGRDGQPVSRTVPVLGNRHTLPTLIQRYHITTLVMAITNEVPGELLQILTDCLELGVEIVPMPVLYEELTGRVPVEHVGENWYVAMPIQHPLTRPFNRFVKRSLDIVLASLGLLVLIPLTPLIALAIYLDSPGPIFYTQERVGQGGRIFKAYKFRSMVPNAEAGRAMWAQENDPRVTRVGRWLRKTHLDEFPQFLNILKGEMSAVGPRPERPEFVRELSREIPFYRVRHAVKPGMAGWALVKHGYASSKEDALVKLQYDLYYIKHWSPWFDFVILIKTIVDALTFRGRA